MRQTLRLQHSKTERPKGNAYHVDRGDAANDAPFRAVELSHQSAIIDRISTQNHVQNVGSPIRSSWRPLAQFAAVNAVYVVTVVQRSDVLTVWSWSDAFLGTEASSSYA